MTLDNGEEWLLRPVAEGWCRYESLIDGTLGLEDIALMNDALDARVENTRRIKEAEANG